MIKICHETPKCLFEEAKKFNDYDYYLDFLWEDEEYCRFFKYQLQNDRTVIMDSSLFEFHPVVPPIDRFYEHVRAFSEYGKNIEYIVTDVLDNKDATIEKFEEWEANYRKTCPGIAIGVAQGDTVESLRECYKYMAKHADKIAIPFDSKAFDELVPEEEYKNDKLYRWAVGRQRFIRDLVVDNLWCNDKPHHLLGCSYAWEFTNPLYQKISIESLDTSNPILGAYAYMKYEEGVGLESKPATKLVDIINERFNEDQYRLAAYNVTEFRNMVNG